MENNIETDSMNRDILAGKWKQMRGELKTWWGKLTDDDFHRIGGQKDKLIGLLQERIGSMSVKAREFGAAAAKKANEAAPIIGERMKSLASVIREKASREGKIGNAAIKVAGGLESASCYLQERKFDHLGEDFRGLVRRYPLRSVLVGL